MEDRLRALNPLNVLRRGYAVVTKRVDGRLVASRSQVLQGDDLQVRVQDGKFDARVTGMEQEEYGKNSQAEAG